MLSLGSGKPNCDIRVRLWLGLVVVIFLIKLDWCERPGALHFVEPDPELPTILQNRGTGTCIGLKCSAVGRTLMRQGSVLGFTANRVWLVSRLYIF